MTDAVIVAARRTPVATKGRALAPFDDSVLAAHAVRAAVDDAGLDVADVVLGNCTSAYGNIGRVASLAAGLSVRVPGGTVDRQCGSGLAAIIDVARAVADDGRARVGGGVESASNVDTSASDDRWFPRAPFTPPGIDDPGMGEAAEALAVQLAIGASRQRAFAMQSIERMQSAQNRGVFEAETAPVGDVSADESLRGRARVLERLPALFAGGTLTAGTSTRVSDGAAAVVVAASGAGLAVRGSAIVGCDPALPGLGAGFAIEQLLAERGLSTADIAAFELVEAFAPQSIAVLNHLGLDDDDERVCADGGALALGHPWGASGAISVVRLYSRLVRHAAEPGTLGVAAASVGGGLGVAALFEVV